MSMPEYDGAYIKMDTGRLSLIEVQQIFSSIPFEIDLIDRSDKFSWFSNKPNREHLRYTSELGENVKECHPAKVWPIVKKIIDSFKDGSKDFVARPLIMHGHRVYIQYYAVRDENGEYLGTIEFTGSVEPILQAYEDGGWSDASTSASKSDDSVQITDASTGASESEETAVPDASTGASEEEQSNELDASTGASELNKDPNAPGPFNYDL